MSEGKQMMEPPRKARNLLSQYYGINDQNPKPKSPKPPEKRRKSLPEVLEALDTNDFNVGEYLSTILKNKGFDELTKQDGQLQQEIKKYDNDMKRLVYENYSKFISATDTIHQMKTKVEAMEAQMSMQEVSGESNKVQQKMEARKTRIRQLGGVQDMLRKVQWLLSWPFYVQKHSESTGEWPKLVRHYKWTTSLLEKYSNVDTFRSIKEEAQVHINGIRKQLRSSCNQSTTIEIFVEKIRMLVGLSEDSQWLITQSIKILDGILDQQFDGQNLLPQLENVKISFLDPLQELISLIEQLEPGCLTEAIKGWTVKYQQMLTPLVPVMTCESMTWLDELNLVLLQVNSIENTDISTPIIKWINQLINIWIENRSYRIRSLIEQEFNEPSVVTAAVTQHWKETCDCVSAWTNHSSPMITNLSVYVVTLVQESLLVFCSWLSNFLLEQKPSESHKSAEILVNLDIQLLFTLVSELVTGKRAWMSKAANVKNEFEKSLFSIISHFFMWYEESIVLNFDGNAKSVSSFALDLLEQWTKQNDWFQKIFPPSNGTSKQSKTRHTRQASGPYSVADSIFTDKFVIQDKFTLESQSLLLHLVTISLKGGILEHIRLLILSPGHFQQLQIDVEYWRVWLWDQLGNNGINTLLDEITATAFKRCQTEPIPLGTKVKSMRLFEIQDIESIIKKK